MTCPHLKPEEAHYEAHGEALDENMVYEDLFSDILSKQVSVAKLFATLLERREEASSLSSGPSHSLVQGNDSS